MLGILDVPMLLPGTVVVLGDLHALVENGLTRLNCFGVGLKFLAVQGLIFILAEWYRENAVIMVMV